MPPAEQPLDAHAIVDISHESLMRCWTRLIAWAEEERASAAIYLRLARAAAWFDGRHRRDCGAIPSSSSVCAGSARTGRRRPGRSATTRRSIARCAFSARSEESSVLARRPNGRPCDESSGVACS